ncbi:urease accessory protein UreF [Planotetraspora sp. GP83]|uniref:urease accessory protein UreF n=1 Tax=Planotetraspora sp. GP83 TaxID=3156264 RepID=UPI0035121169
MHGRSPGDAAMLLLADSRLPAGGHAHSGGAEEAVRLGTITGPDDLARFLRGRLATAGLVTAALAAAACELGTATAPRTARNEPGPNPAPPGTDGPDVDRSAAGRSVVDGQGTGRSGASRPRADGIGGEAPRAGRPHGHGLAADGGEWVQRWRQLDAEADARTASPAQREASRTQGRLLIRTARGIWPSALLDTLAEAIPEGAHHPVAVGAAAASAGCDPYQAALAAAYNAVTGPATAAVRLLGLDPVTVHRLLADLAPALNDAAHAACASLMDAVVTEPVPGEAAARDSTAGDSAARDFATPRGAGWQALPGHCAPALDLLAEGHQNNPMKLFVS